MALMLLARMVHPSSVEAAPSVLAFFQKAAGLPGRHRGLCLRLHYWSRELQALGHTVQLMPPAYVKPYVKRQKNDMADAEAICEAVGRANMRVRANKDARAAELPGAPPYPSSVHSPANRGD